MKKHNAKSDRKAKVKAKRQAAITRDDIENVTEPLPYRPGAKIMMSRSLRAAVLQDRKDRSQP